MQWIIFSFLGFLEEIHVRALEEIRGGLIHNKGTKLWVKIVMRSKVIEVLIKSWENATERA